MNTFTIESEEALLWLRPGTAVKSIYGFSLIPKRIANLESIGVSVEEPVEVVAQSPVGDIVSYKEGSRKATLGSVRYRRWPECDAGHPQGRRPPLWGCWRRGLYGPELP